MPIERHAPRVSVVLPTHNRNDTLRRAIASVLAQSYTDFELIVVDDGSSEDIQQVVKAFGDPRAICWRRDQRGGPGAARNEGIRRARGEFIAFQDSDDEWLVNKLARQVEVFERSPPEIGLVCAGYFIDQESGRPRYVAARAAFLDEKAVLSHFHFFAPMWLARTSMLRQAGLFDESLPSREDWELAIRLSGHCRFAGVAEPLVIKHRITGSVSANLTAHVTSLRNILDRHAARFVSHPDAFATHLRELGLLQFLFADAGEGRLTLLRSVQTAPPGFRSAMALLGTLAGRRAALALREELYKCRWVWLGKHSGEPPQ